MIVAEIDRGDLDDIEQREIKRKKNAIEYAERTGNVMQACWRFGIARSTFYL